MKDLTKEIKIEFKVIGEKMVRDSFANLSKTIPTITSKLSTFFGKIENISQSVIPTTNYIEEALTNAIPTLKSLSDKAEEANKIYKKAQDTQIFDLTSNIVSKYELDKKYTEESRARYAEHFKFLNDLYAGDLKETIKINKQKETYEKEYQERQKTIQEEATTKTTDKKTLTDLIESVKHKNDIKKDAWNSDLTNSLAYLQQEEEQVKERNKSIEDYTKSVIAEKTKSVSFFYMFKKDEMKKDLEYTISVRKKNLEASKEEKEEIAKHYDKIIAAYEKGSDGEKEAIANKRKAMADINAQIQKDKDAIKNVPEEYNKAYEDFYDKMSKKITAFYDKWKDSLSMVTSGLGSLVSMDLDSLKEDKKKTEAVIAESTAEYQKHADKAKALNEEMKQSSGGRSIAIQEQYAREQAAASELLVQKKNAEKEKEKIDTEIRRKERLNNKIKKVESIAKSTADQAAAIVKAWGMGPVLGPIMAALTAAATGIQIKKMISEWGKMEDGGLLRGKRHTQGGMRIEGTNIEVEGDEFVVNRVSTQRNLGLIDYINKQRRELSPDDISSYFTKNKGYSKIKIESKRMYEAGGQLTNLEVIDSNTINDTNKILEAISRINFSPVVSVVDIANVQNNITTIKEIAGA